AAGPELTLRRGSGGVSAISDLEFITNGMIGELDHAKLLWRLVTVDRRPAGVWLVLSEASPSIAVLLLRGAWMPIVALILALLAWVWRKAVRFGPVLQPPPAGSRSLLEHVEAAGS